MHIMREPDAITIKAQEVYGFMARHPFPEQIDLTFIFKMAGLRVGSEMAKAVWERVLLRLEIEADYRKRTQGSSPQSNGVPHDPEAHI